jgi:histidinol-phosphate aminotransferase
MLNPATPPPIRPELAALPGYQPVEPVAALAQRLGLDPATVLKLDANENPFGTPAAVQQAIADAGSYAVYPDPAQRELRDALAHHVDVDAGRIVAGAGSDELIDLTLRALAAPGQRVLVCPPTFGMYGFLCDLHGIERDEIERKDDFSLDLDAVSAAVTDQTALILLASPNNPTGNALSDAELEALLATGTTVVVDEAYAEFSGRSHLSWVLQHPRLIVLRTFSKWAGLAGLRVGFGVFPPPVARVLMSIKQPYNINVAGEVAALAALAQADDYRAQIDGLVAARNDLAARLAEFAWIQPAPSDANFLLCRVDGETDGTQSAGASLRDALAGEGVFVRYFDSPERLRGYIRISLPRPDQLDDLVQRLGRAAIVAGLT